jgi:UDP-N-acetylglucosamine 2-epimerase (non-hydrolysing)
MKKFKIINVVGARPNFMKIAPIMREMEKCDSIDPILLHTGQHYDEKMSKLFFDDLRMPEPDIYLNVGSGSHAQQTAKVMVEFEKVLHEYKPDLVLVVGDVNSTLACSVVSTKMHIPVAHVEAGLRSYDRDMPEEINRIVTDSISDYLFTTCADADENLLKEGVSKDKVFFVGNVMIDTLRSFESQFRDLDFHKDFGESYALLTLHRPSNVDDKENFSRILKALEVIQEKIKIVFPIHPRTRKNIEALGLKNKVDNMNNLNLIDPLGYLEFMSSMANASIVLSDSGGIQEETTVLGIPCLTLRENTERPITITEGTNILVGIDSEKIIDESLKIIEGKEKESRIPDLWDGNAAVRIVRIIKKEYGLE